MNHHVQWRWKMRGRVAGGVMRGHWTKSGAQIQSNLPDSVDPPARLRESFAMAAHNPFFILPFVLLLGAMAFAPVLAPRWWLKNYARVALGLGAATVGGYVFILRDAASLAHTAHEYFSFMVIGGALYVVSGGIHIGVKGAATPFRNVIFLLTGAVVANFLGTTGAAMLLIRPWIRMNQNRIAAHHIVFFIFIIANVGGCLTPIGDPPLFLGYLQGVPFWWVAKNCWPMWIVGVGLLLAMFYVVDKINFVRDPRKNCSVEPAAQPVGAQRQRCTEKWEFNGLPNLFFLAVILGAVFVKMIFVREVLMIAAALGSYFTTKKSVHAANDFDFHPVIEVAILFAGIFATMTPALGWLNFHAREILGANPSPGVFYWGAGGLSAVLDNAPTYLGFLNALFGATGAKDIADLLGQNPLHILAISIGSVFFGAATYIGNGPNFMVKAIADRQKIPTPTFFGFVFKYALTFLIPVTFCVWLIFFHR
jgi:Na+/H+ antiporter NhaD/arsenite permease-like protein